MEVSVCIITYNRPEFFREALQSCLDQTLPPAEILIGDDSTDQTTGEIVKEVKRVGPINIRYFHNSPPLRQAANINNLFAKAQGEVLVLLHDDDLLLPEALELMHESFIKYPGVYATFGKQYIISAEGTIDREGSEVLNQHYYRGPEYEGSRLSSLESGFLQQFPNDAYMVRTDLAKSVMYREEAEDACDFDFGLRLGMSNGDFHFIDKYTAKYRLSYKAVSRNPKNNASLKSYELVRDLKVPVTSLELKARWLKQKAPLAVGQAIRLKKKKKAIAIFFSKWHRSRIFTPSGVKVFFRLFLS